MTRDPHERVRIVGSFTLHPAVIVIVAIWTIICLGMVVIVALAAPARACDLALVLLQDTSSSLDEAELVQMREGVANALTDPRLASSFTRAQVQITVVRFSGGAETVVGWFTADDATLARAAETIRTMPRTTKTGGTAIGSAIAYALRELERVDCARHVIDVATDGENNGGPTPHEITATLDPFAVQVNGLVIGGDDDVALFERTTQFGASAFTLGVASYDDFGKAMLRKLSLEVSMNTRGPGWRT